MPHSDNHSTPVVLSTWPFGLPANAAAWAVLESGGTSLDAVQAGATQCEFDPSVDSVGLGGLPDAAGEVTLDASIMDHAGRCGAVACLKRVVNAVGVARRVMEATPHVMLVGEAATRFALEQGFPEANLLTETAAAKYREWLRRRTNERAAAPQGHDTLGILAIDAAGRLAGACTTSGMAFKHPGRVGDSPIIGAGLYVAGGVGAASATGVGEEMIKVCGSFAIVEHMRRGMAPREAIEEVLRRVLARHGGDAKTDVSFIALRADGEVAGMSLRAKTKFKYAVTREGRGELVDAPTLVGT
jgi:N4-(beta-N-acetylglucosaminyl)-L-asparaginase